MHTPLMKARVDSKLRMAEFFECAVAHNVICQSLTMLALSTLVPAHFCTLNLIVYTQEYMEY